MVYLGPHPCSVNCKSLQTNAMKQTGTYDKEEFLRLIMNYIHFKRSRKYIAYYTINYNYVIVYHDLDRLRNRNPEMCCVCYVTTSPDLPALCSMLRMLCSSLALTSCSYSRRSHNFVSTKSFSDLNMERPNPETSTRKSLLNDVEIGIFWM